MLKIENSKVKTSLILIFSTDCKCSYFILYSSNARICQFYRFVVIYTSTIWIYDVLLTPYPLPIWLLLIICILAFISVIKFFIRYITNNKKEEYTKYVRDSIYDATCGDGNGEKMI